MDKYQKNSYKAKVKAFPLLRIRKETGNKSDQVLAANQVLPSTNDVNYCSIFTIIYFIIKTKMNTALIDD